MDIEIIGSGDNQIIMCKMPLGRSPADVQTLLYAGLQGFEEAAALMIKLMETFTSYRYMEYGKACYIDGKLITFEIKRATRIGTESQENIPSINTKVSGCCVTGVASAGDGLTPVPAYFVTCVEVLYSIRERIARPIPVERMVVMFNRQAGGLKMSLYSPFCIRGIDDHFPDLVYLWDYVQRSN